MKGTPEAFDAAAEAANEAEADRIRVMMLERGQSIEMEHDMNGR